MKFIIIIILSFFFTTVASAQEFDTLYTTINFAYNSDVLSETELAKLENISGEIISIEGYASVEGNSERNHALSCRRQHSVSSILDFQGAGYGATSQFGNSLESNRVVIVKYISVKGRTSLEVIPASDTTTFSPIGKSDFEGFTCGQRVDTSVYFNDTTDLVEIPEPLVLETIKISTTVTPELPKLDSFYLPTQNAIRFYMRKGMSRAEATSIVTGRKDQWRPLKKSEVRKPKKRKRMPKKTMGKNDSFMSRLLPFRGC